MGTHFVFSCIYAISIDVGRFRGSNKVVNHFIYTPKHVLKVLEHPPIKGAKVRKCSVPIPILKGPGGGAGTQIDKKSGLLYCIICIYTKLLLIYKGGPIVV